MTIIRAFSVTELTQHDNMHKNVGAQIKTFLDDIGEDCDITLEFDDPDESFEYLFNGTTLSLSFDTDGISVLDFDLDTGDTTTLAVFHPNELNRATHWLLTQANHQNSTS